MLIGGFYHIDPKLYFQEPKAEEFALRCDTESAYGRKIYTGNGRTATSYILLNALHLTKDDVILMPDYLCVSVINALQVCPAQFRFYRIRKDLSADIEDMRSKMDEKVKVLYVIHYFGVPQSEEYAREVLRLKKEYGAAVIEDLTQTLYTRSPGRIGYGDYLVASTRKWMPVTDGGLLAVKDGVDCPDNKLADAYDEAVYRQLLISIMRDYFDTHPLEDKTAYLQMEKEANKARYLDFTPREMTEVTRRILFAMDHEESIRRRRENYQWLYRELSGLEGLEILSHPLDENGDYVPFGLVILVEKRQECYDFLASHGVIGEIQWVLPLEYYDPGEDARYMSDHNIMLQIDQRYGIEEMRVVADLIKEFLEKS